MRRILIVDDERDLRETLRLNLMVEGYEVFTAGDGEEAVAAIEHGETPGLLVLDLRMPKLDGIEALARIRALQPGLPVILMTAYATEKHEEAALDLGVYAIVHKPFDMSTFLRVVERALRSPSLLVIGRDPSSACNGHELGRPPKIVRVATSTAAIDVLRSTIIDVVVLDESCVDSTTDAVEAIRAFAPAMPILVATGQPSSELLAQASRSQIDGWLAKPVTRPSLLRRVAEVRGRGRS